MDSHFPVFADDLAVAPEFVGHRDAIEQSFAGFEAAYSAVNAFPGIAAISELPIRQFDKAITIRVSVAISGLQTHRHQTEVSLILSIPGIL